MKGPAVDPRVSDLATVDRLLREREEVGAALATPERLQERAKSRKAGALTILFCALAPAMLFLSGEGWNRRGRPVDMFRDILLKDELLLAAPALDRCYAGTEPATATIYATISAQGTVTDVSRRSGARLDATCAKEAFANAALEAGTRPMVVRLDVVLLPKRSRPGSFTSLD